MITKYIHTGYFSKDENMSDEMKNWVEGLKTSYPDFIVKIWNLSDLNNFLKQEHEQYITECLSFGKLGYLYASYYFRFYVLLNCGGFWIETLSDQKHDLNSLLDKDFVFEYNCPGHVNMDIIGSKQSSNSDQIIRFILDKFDNRNFIFKNGSLDIYNPHKFLFDTLTEFGLTLEDDVFLEDYGNVWSKNIYLIWNPKKFEGYYKAPDGIIPKVSIVMPMYNAESYLNECIDSVLRQSYKDFELLCIDDGSSDYTAEIVNSYKDDRILYIKREHKGLVKTLNAGLNMAQGEYILRHDADDVMLPHRIEYQINFMKEHPDVDILSNGFLWWNPDSEINDNFYSCDYKYIDVEDMLHGNKMAHPCICMKRSSILSLPYRYEEYFKHAEDYKLWLTALTHGLKLYVDENVVTLYRQTDNQITQTNKNEMWQSTKIAVNAYDPSNINNNKNELTVIIPFQNEGSEIERTVASIRGTSKVNILLVDDCSTDGYDYEKIAKIFGCEYLKTENNLGVAGCRDFGIEHCSTEYFLLLDGHMRFYDFNWEIPLLKELKNRPNAIVNGNTLVYSYNIESDEYDNEFLFNYEPIWTRAAVVNTWEDSWIFTGKWTNTEYPGYNDQNIVPIACNMGAVYASNKTWWNHIDGLKGLEKWGQDEPYMSMKTWLAGGEVVLMKHWGIGHLYRDMAGYVVPVKQRLMNRIFLIHFFLQDDQEIERQLKLLRNSQSSGFDEGMKVFEQKKDYLLSLKDHFWKNIATRDLQWFYDNINDKVR